MDFQIEAWIAQYVAVVTAKFEKRVWFIGIQGSWGRGEAASSSDIDMVLILDTVSYDDLQVYDSILTALPWRDKVCGFVSGKNEIEEWDKSDLFQFCNDTTALYGSLNNLLQSIGRADIERAVKIGACNIYHGCVHNVLHEKSGNILRELYKSASFTLRAVLYLEKGIFVKKQEQLLPLLSSQDRAVLERNMALKQSIDISQELFAQSSDMLIRWASKRIQNLQM